MERDEVSEEDVSQMWEAYEKVRDNASRNDLAEYYLPLVRYTAGRLAISLPSHVDRDDLLSSGFFGLLDAIERFDAARNIKFETYASVRIRGAMVDYLRAKDWMPVTARSRVRKYGDTMAKLTNELGRAPTDEEIQKDMALDDKEFRQLQAQLAMATMLPIDDMGIELEASAPSPSASMEAEELKKTLAKAIDKLPEKERMVVSLYYYDELTLKEIAQILHLTEARISQLHTKAVFRLRGSLARMKASLF